MIECGGAFALLTFLHFFADWIFQSHDEAMSKHRDWKVRARHCAVYTAPFAIVLTLAEDGGAVSAAEAVGLAALLFLSHFVEDTYYPVLLWAKYVRRPPEMRWSLQEEVVLQDGHHSTSLMVVAPVARSASEVSSNESRVRRCEVAKRAADGLTTVGEARREFDRLGFVEFVSTPLGKILMIAVDQIVHLAFLLPVAHFLTRK